MGSPLSRRPSRADTQEPPTSRKLREQPVNPSHKLYRTKPCRNFAMGHCRFGDKCAYLHAPLAPPNQATTPNYLPTSAPALSPLQHFSAGKALPPSPVSTDGSDSSGPNSVEDLNAMMQQYTLGQVMSMPGSGLMHGMSLPPVPPCTPATYDPFMNPQSTPEVRLIHVPVPVPVLPAMYRRGSESLVYSSPNSKGGSPGPPLRNRSRSITYGVNLFKTKPCAFYVEKGRCLKGDRCNFIHETPEIDAEKAQQVEQTSTPALKSRSSSVSARPSPISIPSPLSQAPTPVPGDKHERSFGRNRRNRYERKQTFDDGEGYHPISWRVIGGGVMMSGHREICPDYIAGRCTEESDCKFAHPEHDLYEEPISLSPTSFYPTTQNGVPMPLPIQAGHFYDPVLGSPMSLYYSPSSPPSSTTTTTSFSSLSPPVSPPMQRRRLRRRTSSLRKELKLSVDTSKSDRTYTPNRIFDGRTLLEYANTHTEDVHFVDAYGLPEIREPSKESQEPLTEQVENDTLEREEATEGGLFSPRCIVRPVSTPPTPVSSVDSMKVVRLFSAEMP